MKILVALFLSCAAVIGDDNTNAPDLTVKISEHERDGGKTRLHVETTYRNKKPIIQAFCTVRGGVTNASRSYLVGGDLVMIETNDNGDGLFEAFFIYRPGTKDIEMFTRKTDGSVKPVSSQTLLATKKQIATANDAVVKLFHKDGLTDREFEDLVLDTQKKIQAAEKEKSKDKK